MNGDTKMKTRLGYTLIEILVVLALLSILLSMAVPNLSLYKRMKENMELERLKKDLLFTRNSAILEGSDYYVTFYYIKNEYSIKNIKDNEVIKTVYFKNGIKINNKSKNIVFHFKSNGTIGNSDTILLTNSKGQNFELKLTPVTGNINIVK